MPNITRYFSGGLNSDDDPYRLSPNDWIDSLNVTKDAKGQGQDLLLTNIIGNQQVAYSLPAGTNKVIGKYGDSVRNRLYYCVYNSNGNNLVLFYDGTNDIVTKVLISKTDTGGVDILNFDASNLITSMNIIYRDSGDLLFFLDSLGRPTEMNIQKFLNGTYTNIQRSYIDLAKIPPSMPIKPVYENDTTVTQNNFKNQLFKFKHRWVYDTNEKSTWSSGSIVPMPYQTNDQNITTDKSYNARINLYFSTGNETVTGIELAVSQNLGAGASDYQLITLLSKSDLSIANNIISNFLFYNDSVYPNVDVTEVLLRQDFIPVSANAMDFPNGNVCALAGITEGYDIVKGDFTGTSALTVLSDTIGGMLFFASQDDTDSYGTSSTVIVRLRGVGSNTAGVPTTILQANGAIFYVKAVLQNGTDVSFQYTSATTSIATILAGLLAAAIVQGFTGSVSGTTLTLSRTNVILLTSYYEQSLANVTNYLLGIEYSRLPQCSYTDGIVYEDEKGVTNGVVTTTSLNISTPNLDMTDTKKYPLVTITINHRPPLWAKWYRPVRTPELSFNKQLFWVSRQALSNVSSTGILQYSQIAYIDISNMEEYNLNVQSTSNHISYEFEAGDRIRFLGRYPVNATAVQLSTDLDFEIVGVESDPLIYGVARVGRFIKIKYPTAQISTDFKFDGLFDGTLYDFQNYKIFIYSQRKNNTTDTNVYYEYGVRYPIGNPGTVTAYHIGNRITQSTNLVTPATNIFYYGDEFLRYLNIPAGNQYVFKVVDHVYGGLVSGTLGFDIPLPMSSPINTSGYILKSNTPASVSILYSSTDYPTYASTDCLYQNLTSSVATVIVRFTLLVNFADVGVSENVSVFIKTLNNTVPFANYVVTQILPASPIITENTIYEFPIDATIGVPPNGKIWLIVQSGFADIHVFTSDFNIEVITVPSVEIIDTSFSDIVEIDINSNDSTRPDIFEVNAKLEYYPATLRHGQAYQDNTSINQVNRFYPDTIQDYDRRYMDIIRLRVSGSYMHIYQRLKVGRVPIFIQIIQDTAGNPLQAQTEKLLNKILYYQEEQGLGFSPASLAWSSGAEYFVNDIKGTVCRLAANGITVISLYKANAFFTDKLQWFRTDINDGYYVPDGNPQVLGVFDPYTNKYIVALEEINRYTETIPHVLAFHQDAYTLAFNENDNRWESQYSYKPEMMGVLNTLLFTFKNGNIWKHNSETYCNFYGTQYPCSVTLVFNDATTFKKTFLAIMETGTITWVAPEITTSMNSYGATKQQSELKQVDFKTLETTYNATFLRDSNSQGGLINGGSLKGEYIIIKLQVNEANAASLVALNSVSVKYIESFMNNR